MNLRHLTLRVGSIRPIYVLLCSTPPATVPLTFVSAALTSVTVLPPFSQGHCRPGYAFTGAAVISPSCMQRRVFIAHVGH